jgi:hypothetical protein
MEPADERLAVRAGRSAMTRVRSAALIVAQRAISSMLRPQPVQSRERASRVHTLTQGLSIIAVSGADSAAP